MEEFFEFAGKPGQGHKFTSFIMSVHVILEAVPAYMSACPNCFGVSGLRCLSRWRFRHPGFLHLPAGGKVENRWRHSLPAGEYTALGRFVCRRLLSVLTASGFLGAASRGACIRPGHVRVWFPGAAVAECAERYIAQSAGT